MRPDLSVQALVLLLCLETKYSPAAFRNFTISASEPLHGEDDNGGRLSFGIPVPKCQPGAVCDGELEEWRLLGGFWGHGQISSVSHGS
jgi:hypothetical protein